MVVKMVVRPIAKLSEEAWVRSWVCMRWLVDTIVMPKTTDRLCAPYLRCGEVSCQNGDRVVLNAKRWLLGADSYGSDLTNYRRYLVNHEFGHALGKHHVDCPGPGRLAPVMMQHHQGARRLPEEPGRNPAKIDSGVSAIGTLRAPGRRVANSRQRSSAPARERPRGTGALERLQWTGSVHAVAHQASWTPRGGSSPRAGAALHCFLLLRPRLDPARGRRDTCAAVRRPPGRRSGRAFGCTLIRHAIRRSRPCRPGLTTRRLA
jgi:hypothetical protein